MENTMLNTIDQEIWELNHPLNPAGIQLGHRMVVIRLHSGELLVHSPTPLDEHLAGALEALGTVRCIVAPSCFHDLFLPPYFERYPDAAFCCVPGFSAQHPEFPFTDVLSDHSPDFWQEDIEHLVIQGLPSLNEAVFLHRRSHSLIVADLVFNIRGDCSFMTRLVMKLNGAYNKTAPSRLFKTFIKDRSAMKASLQQVLEWDFDRIIVGHGEVVETGGKEALRQAYAWL